MKKLFLLSLIAMVMNQSFAQQPFEEYGYKVKVATLSGGKYVEFFDQDTLVQIGSIVLSTNTGKIVSFVQYDTVYSEATLDPQVISRWLSPDPLSSKYYSLSPYNFVANNPIKYIDPDGRKIIVFGARYGFLGLRRHKYEYHAGASAPEGANQFAQNAFKALNYAQGGDSKGIINALAESDDKNISIKSTGKSNGFYNQNNNTIRWNSELGAELLDEDANVTGRQPAALVLFHEVGHGYRENFMPEEYYADLATEDPQYGNVEERKVIENYETPAATTLGHGTRTNHSGRLYPTEDPTSVTPRRVASPRAPGLNVKPNYIDYIGSAGPANRRRDDDDENKNH